MDTDTSPAITIPVDEVLKRLGPNGEHWTKGTWQDNGNMCLHQGIRLCQPQPGDAYLIEQVAAREGWGVAFNDAEATEWGDITAALDQHREVSPHELEATFGPNWELIAVVVRQAATLTKDQINQLDTARDAARAAAGAAARGAARAAARAAARGAAWDAAWDAAGAATRDATWAAAVRDLIGQHGFTQDHYDTLTAPWRAVFPGFDQ